MNTQAHLHGIKMMDARQRAMTIQARGKIKPASMRPNLLNSPSGSTLHGGDVVNPASEDFYYPSVSGQEMPSYLGPTQWTAKVEEQTNKTVSNTSSVAPPKASMEPITASIPGANIAPQVTTATPCDKGIRF